MPVKIFTIPFNEETQSFHDDLVVQFCVNKRIHKIDTKFFTRNHQPFWTVAIHYGQILFDEKSIKINGTPAPEEMLDDQQKALLLRMKEWRKGAAEEVGLPVYMLATNAQFVSMIRQKCVTLESLKLVKGFGKTKMEKYGKALTDIIRQFYHGE